eukprot:scaffold84966_cov68-Phaeocystis_antarctica.AAC.9
MSGCSSFAPSSSYCARTDPSLSSTKLSSMVTLLRVLWVRETASNGRCTSQPAASGTTKSMPEM